MKTRSAAFSLAEIAIALGLLSFVLLAVVGLLGVGLNSSKEASISTSQAALARQVLTQVGTNSFPLTTNITKNFALDGTLVTNISDAYFVCTVTTNAVTDLPAEALANFQALKIQFAYPAGAPASNRTTNTIHASFSR